MKLTIDGGHVIEGKPEELKEYFELMGVEFPLKADEEEEFAETITYKGAEYTLVDGDYIVALPEADGVYSVINTDMKLGKIDYIGVGGFISVKIIAHKDSSMVGRFFPGSSRYFRKATEDEVAEAMNPYKPTEGDIVVITGNTNFSRNKVGDIGKVGEVNPAGTAKVDVPSKPKTLDVNGNWTKFSEMRPATEGEKAQYEKALKVAKGSEKMAKIGRKPGVFKKGDIVRGERYSDSSAKFLGIVEDISGSMIGVRSGDSRYHAAEKAKSELIAPVESRVDTE